VCAWHCPKSPLLRAQFGWLWPTRDQNRFQRTVQILRMNFVRLGVKQKFFLILFFVYLLPFWPASLIRGEPVLRGNQSPRERSLGHMAADQAESLNCDFFLMA